MNLQKLYIVFTMVGIVLLEISAVLVLKGSYPVLVHVRGYMKFALAWFNICSLLGPMLLAIGVGGLVRQRFKGLASHTELTFALTFALFYLAFGLMNYMLFAGTI